MIVWAKIWTKKKQPQSNRVQLKIIAKKYWKKIFLFLKKHSKKVYIVLWILFVFVVFKILIDLTVFSNINHIRKVTFNKESVKIIDDEFLYSDITDVLKWQNYFTMKYWKFSKSVAKIKSEYKLVDSILLYKSNPNEAYVDVIFHKPSLIFDNWKKNIWVYNWYFFDVSTWSNLLTWHLIIKLPEYTQSGLFSWFFYKISEKTLTFQFNQIEKTYGKKYIKSVEYIPGWWKSILTLIDWKIIYFDHNKNISEQLNKFLLLQKNYSLFQTLREVDLWSQTDLIVK